MPVFGLLLEHASFSDWVLESPLYNKYYKVFTAPLWVALLSAYTLTTFFGLLAAGLVASIYPDLFTPLFTAVLDKVAPSDTFSARPYVSSRSGNKAGGGVWTDGKAGGGGMGETEAAAALLRAQ